MEESVDTYNSLCCTFYGGTITCLIGRILNFWLILENFDVTECLCIWMPQSPLLQTHAVTRMASMET